MTAQLELSPFRPAFAAEVAGWAGSLEEARAWCGHNTKALPAAADVQQWRDDPDVHPCLLTSDGAAVGYGEIWVDRAAREIELARLIVSPPQRGRGIGRRLVEELLAVAAEFGFDFAYVRVAPDNAAALACYRRAGFAHVSAADQKRFNAGQPIDYIWLSRPF